MSERRNISNVPDVGSNVVDNGDCLASRNRFLECHPPPNWLHCPETATMLIQALFVPCKIFLDCSRYQTSVPEKNTFSPSSFVKDMNSVEVYVSLVIDLTSTNYYYTREELVSNSCMHVNIPCTEDGSIPSRQSVVKFIGVCSDFARGNVNLNAIAVHCMQGFNLTGFMICSYLVEEKNISIDAAVKEFSMKRPPGIYNQSFLDELYRRYDNNLGDGNPASHTLHALAPAPPTWHSGAVELPRNPCSATVDNFPGLTAVTHQPLLAQIRKDVLKLCDYKPHRFPGCRPVPLTRMNLDKLKEDMYHVSWISDGKRFLLTADKAGEVFLVDEDFNVFHAPNVNLRDPRNIKAKLTKTLLDGELVIDKDPKHNRISRRFLINDIILLSGSLVKDFSFLKRWSIIYTQIIVPRHTAIKNKLLDTRNESFSIRRKDFLKANKETVQKITSNDFRKKILHNVLGIKFVPSFMGYSCGRCDSQLFLPNDQWIARQRVNFKLKFAYSKLKNGFQQQNASLCVSEHGTEFGPFLITHPMSHKLHNTVVEFALHEGIWTAKRCRGDVFFPSSLLKVKEVSESYMFNVDLETLLNHLPNKREDSGYDTSVDSTIQTTPSETFNDTVYNLFGNDTSILLNKSQCSSKSPRKGTFQDCSTPLHYPDASAMYNYIQCNISPLANHMVSYDRVRNNSLSRYNTRYSGICTKSETIFTPDINKTIRNADESSNNLVNHNMLKKRKFC
uniref:mRNA-capping enzyme-like n=1 Tax=Hirondellea gigas TaxID=1518452 RepID=A0A6A7G1Z7_9CRUS